MQLSPLAVFCLHLLLPPLPLGPDTHGPKRRKKIKTKKIKKIKIGIRKKEKIARKIDENGDKKARKEQ